jgi:glycolate oxidase FAD binding subunit
MSKQQTELCRLIESVAGPENVTAEPALQMDGLSPALLVKPGSPEEVAQCLRICSDLNAAVVPAGLMTWLECGNPVTRADVVLSLQRMNRVIEYSPPDLTATVEAGLTLSDFNKAAGRERQWLPFDPPGSVNASLGAVASCNSSGALRLGFGTPRDYVIGLRLAHADGTESKSGGRVVKNVAGYDLNKLYVGSYGTLAVITEVTFKLRSLPESIITVAATPKKPVSLAGLAGVITASELQPASITLTNMRLEGAFKAGHEFDTLLLRFVDNEAAVKYQADRVMQACGGDYQTALLGGGHDAAVWAGVAEMDARRECAVRLSVPLSEAVAAYERVSDDFVVTADLGTGTIRVAFDVADKDAAAIIKRLRADAAAQGGTLMIERAPAAVRKEADAWGDVGAAAGLMRSIKAKFDPQNLLSPGRFVAGI